jgi:hypothetical protein
VRLVRRTTRSSFTSSFSLVTVGDLIFTFFIYTCAGTDPTMDRTRLVRATRRRPCSRTKKEEEDRYCGAWKDRPDQEQSLVARLLRQDSFRQCFPNKFSLIVRQRGAPAWCKELVRRAVLLQNNICVSLSLSERLVLVAREAQHVLAKCY